MYGELIMLMDDGAHCDTLEAVDLLVQASAEHQDWEEPDTAAQIDELAVFDPLRESAGADHPAVLRECGKVRLLDDA